MNVKLVNVVLAFSIANFFCSAHAELINPNATIQTKQLYQNLQGLEGKVLFGHEDSLAYGNDWWGTKQAPLYSDIKGLTGSYPAVFGADIGGIGLGNDKNLDGVSFNDYRHYIQSTFQMGGVNTISWHMYSPVDGHNSWSKNSYVSSLIPGGKDHQKLKGYLDSFIAFNETLKVDKDNKQIWIPIVFRPWHEHNGDWFWWGKGHTTEQEYKALWKFTVEYLIDKKQNNLIFAFSPDRSRLDLADFKTSYLYGYAGDQYVDLLGMDNYWDLGHGSNKLSSVLQQAQFIESLEKLTDLASKKRKVSALTEGGQEGVKEPNFWSERFVAGLLHSEKTRRLSYALVWRNNFSGNGKQGHFFASYPGQGNDDDFIKMSVNADIIMSDSLPHLYK